MNGLKTTISILLQFLFLLFRVFGEHFCFAMGQCHGDFSQSTAQFLKLVGRQRCLSTHPLSALLVEINRGAILICFILEYRQRHERRPRAAQDGFHLGLLPWGGESSNVGVNESHDSAQKADRKSTRLNSSHSQISYAVFCLKKKTKISVVRHGRERRIQARLCKGW